MKRLLLVLFVVLIGLPSSANTAETQAAESVVREFFDNISYWFENAKTKNRLARVYYDKAKSLTQVEQCHFVDKITNELGFGDCFIADWLGFFSKERVENGCSLRINAIRYHCDEPRITTTGGGIWIYADVTFYYDNNKSIRISDYFRVLKGKIYRVDQEGSELSKAIKLYNNKNYYAAFPIFLKISESGRYEFEAQYYAVVMLTLKQGCDNLTKSARKNYAVKYSYYGYTYKNEPLADLYMKYYYQYKPR
ncbi:MAG: hypothetical protein IJ150_01955 [Bacteroidales bacterium]|nr:hypothetical protein [Bacteroidales bacterium]